MPLKDPLFRPVSLRCYIPELEPLIMPGGRIVELLTHCFDSHLMTPSGYEIPVGFYFTTCEEPVVHNYRVPGIVWDSYSNISEDCCPVKICTDGINPCSSGCTSPSCENPVHWEAYLPDPMPEEPVLLADCEGDTLAADDSGNELWWY